MTDRLIDAVIQLYLAMVFVAGVTILFWAFYSIQQMPCTQHPSADHCDAPVDPRY